MERDAAQEGLFHSRLWIKGYVQPLAQWPYLNALEADQIHTLLGPILGVLLASHSRPLDFI